MPERRSSLGLQLYIGALTIAAIALVPFALTKGFEGGAAFWVLFVFAILFAASEGFELFFHHERGRQSLAAGEAVLLPMLFALSWGQVVLSVAISIAAVATFYWRMRGLKWLFNVSEHALGAGLAAASWILLSGDSGFSPRNAVAAVVGTVVYVVVTHMFVAGAISLSEGGKYWNLLRSILGATLWKLAAALTLGMLFASAYSAATWTLVLFPLPLLALFFGYRAVLRQDRERQRVEHLHAASRALASTPEMSEALLGFLHSVGEIVSAIEARLIIADGRGVRWSGVRGDDVVASLQPLGGGGMLELFEGLRATREEIVANPDDEGRLDNPVARALEATSVLAVPLQEGDTYIGTLVALGRVGADEFNPEDARLLAALGNELVVTLGSYRLFAQVAEERERFQQIFAGSKEGICLLDEEGVIRAWNPALARITGFEEEDIIGEKWSERVLVRDRNHRRIEGMDIITVPPDEELELVTRQGPPRWVAIMSGEVPTEDKNSWVLLVRDITAEHELEESKSDFLSTISHELRTPLTTIKGSLQVLSRPNASASSDIGKQMVEIMKRGSDRLERLVMNLLAVSQMESGDVQVYPDEVPLEELVRSRIPSILPDHPQVQLEVEEEVAVRADRERLAQAIEHLLDNARKFGPESGLIRIEIAKENGFARLSVSDEGPGIPKIDQARIFDRFVRLGHVLTRETQGPGVGLFIVKKSIEAMSGSVEVESDSGRGTTFHLRIPLAHPMAAIDNAS